MLYLLYTLLALLLLAILIKIYPHIVHFYHSVIIWYEVRKAKRKLAKLGKHEMANDLRWDNKWLK